ncbi:dihydrodipicolinate synthase family protein [Kitasatospora sp. NPDC048540]|uniref:dihydrodipicolinate synthase family protein n=1 Tax=unclassified Kitasatospora TaxID=2633591 RepID=UPI00053A948C|nr:dihydrodipicolinate synthase family protein [Kitasatospora sp. MBT63]
MEPLHTELHGVHVPLITPFAADGSVAYDALEALAVDALDAGAAGLVALGTTGEPAALSAEERAAVIRTVGAVCRARGMVFTAGAGDAQALAELAGVADAALVTVPAFVRPGEAGVLAHFTRLAADSPVPLVVYHIPYRTGQALGAATLRRIGELPGVAGMKLAAGAVDGDIVGLFADLPPGFAVLSGDDLLISPLMALGATGGILASAHLATDRFVALAAAWRAGRVDEARELGHRLAGLSAAAFTEPNPTVVKGVLHAQGRIPTADVRLPLLPAAKESVEAALAALAALERVQPTL